MTVEKNTNYGNITVTEEAIASLTGEIVAECYGVVGMASRKLLKDGLAQILGKENYAKGVSVSRTDAGLVIDVYIIVSFGVRISEVTAETQKKVKYILEKTLAEEVAAVNIYVQGVEVIE